ncbi:MAG TPA: ASCH domain-containing protein, partial [Chloroflexi bacterium]|nr:ASCH domain-containing protein [Chloroflexota bacterium]
MKALSVRQPWAWLIAQGYKTVENRTWATNYRGPLLIHAGKKPDLTRSELDEIRRIFREEGGI